MCPYTIIGVLLALLALLLGLPGCSQSHAESKQNVTAQPITVRSDQKENEPHEVQESPRN